WSRCKRHPAGLNARNQTMLRDGHERRVQYGCLGCRRLHARHEQVEVVGERQLADQIGTEIEAPHGNRCTVRGGDRRTRDGFLANFHVSPLSVEETAWLSCAQPLPRGRGSCSLVSEFFFRCFSS